MGFFLSYAIPLHWMHQDWNVGRGGRGGTLTGTERKSSPRKSCPKIISQKITSEGHSVSLQHKAGTAAQPQPQQEEHPSQWIAELVINPGRMNGTRKCSPSQGCHLSFSSCSLCPVCKSYQKVFYVKSWHQPPQAKQNQAGSRDISSIQPG